MPRYYLLQAGVDPKKDLARFAFSGAHDATAKWVEQGKVDAGALNESVWNKLLEEKKVDPAKVVVFYTTPDFYDYNWTVRGDLDPQVVKKLKAAFLALDPANPEQKAILDLQRTKKFIETKPENYLRIEEALDGACRPAPSSGDGWGCAPPRPRRGPSPDQAASARSSSGRTGPAAPPGPASTRRRTTALAASTRSTRARMTRTRVAARG